MTKYLAGLYLFRNCIQFVIFASWILQKVYQKHYALRPLYFGDSLIYLNFKNVFGFLKAWLNFKPSLWLFSPVLNLRLFCRCLWDVCWWRPVRLTSALWTGYWIQKKIPLLQDRDSIHIQRRNCFLWSNFPSACIAYCKACNSFVLNKYFSFFYIHPS